MYTTSEAFKHYYALVDKIGKIKNDKSKESKSVKLVIDFLKKFTPHDMMLLIQHQPLANKSYYTKKFERYHENPTTNSKFLREIALYMLQHFIEFSRAAAY